MVQPGMGYRKLLWMGCLFLCCVSLLHASELVYSTFLSGSMNAYGYSIAVDSAGNTYITGYTDSRDFPTTAGVMDTTFGAASTVFVTKLNSSGSSLVYSTFLGGTTSNSYDVGNGIAVDAAGYAYIAGFSEDSEFPTTDGAFQTTYHRNNGYPNAFVSKITTDGSSLVYSTFLGGTIATNYDEANAIAVDTGGNAYVTGFTRDADFPITAGAFDTSLYGEQNAFMTKLNANGNGLLYSTFIGSSTGSTLGLAIATDKSANAYVTGWTETSTFPTTVGAFDTTFKGLEKAFVTKVNTSGSGLVYSTLLGGTTGSELGRGIAVDKSGYAYIGGVVNDPSFPITSGAFDSIYNGTLNGFVTKLTTDGSGLVYSTFLGGTIGSYYIDEVWAITVDAGGDAYMTGYSFDPHFPTTSGAFDTILNTNGSDAYADAFVTRLNASGSALVYSTYIGGYSDEQGDGIAVDSSGNVYITGYTSSGDFPVTQYAYQTVYQDTTNSDFSAESFVTKIFTGTVSISDWQMYSNPTFDIKEPDNRKFIP